MKKIRRIFFVIAVVAGAGINVYKANGNYLKISDFQIENFEALACQEDFDANCIATVDDKKCEHVYCASEGKKVTYTFAYHK